MAVILSFPTTPSSQNSPKRRILKIISLSLASLMAALISGCTTQGIPITSTNANAQISGNWQFNSASTTSVLPALAGNLSVSGNQVSGTLHPLASPYDCVTYKTSFPVSGPIDSDGKMTLTSSGFSGGNLTLTGQLSAARTSLTTASYGVANGICSLTSTPTSGTQYTPINGTYNGTIYSVAGTSLYVSTVFTQTTQPDTNGTYHLQGNSTFGSLQPCLPVPPTVSDSTVTGSTLSATYTESPNGTLITVVVDATFNPDASALTLNSYHITGGYCDGDSGHGTLTRQ